MAGLIERMARTAAVMMQPTGVVVDGVPQMVAVNCMVYAMDNARQGFDEYGRVQYGKAFLVAPLAAAPVLPGTITVDGITCTMASVQPYRNMRGVLMGVYITVAGEA